MQVKTLKSPFEINWPLHTLQGWGWVGQCLTMLLLQEVLDYLDSNCVSILSVNQSESQVDLK